MRISTLITSTMVLASSFALAKSNDNAKTYEAIIDPPLGTMHCGFTISGTVKSPQYDVLSSGFFFRSESNIITAIDRRHTTQPHLFAGPGELRLTASSKDFGDDSLFQKRKHLQVQLRVWRFNALPPGPNDAVPQIPTLTESAWVDIPLTSPTCASMQPMPDLSPVTGISAAPSTSAAPAPNPPATVKRQTRQEPKP